MEMINKLMLNLGKFSKENWNLIISITILISIGGIISSIFGWPFALIVPLWILFMCYIAKKQYNKNIEKN